MATYFSSLTDQRDDLPMPLLPNEKHNSYQSSGLPDNLMYLNHPSSYPELSSGSSLPAHNYGEAQSIRSRDEVLFIPPTSDPATMQPIGRLPNVASSFSDVNSATVEPHTYATKPFNAQNVEPNLQYQGLSLSLAMQVPSSVQVPAYHDQYTNSGFSSLMSTHIMHSDQGSHNNENKSAEYLSFDLAGAQNSVKIGASDNLDRSMSLREVNFNPQMHDASAVAGSIYNSKYLKATQDLLDEVVNVHTSLKQSDKHHNLHSFGQDEETDMKSSCSGTGMASDGHKSTNTSSGELSAAERHDLESKMTKLFSMLDEVSQLSYHVFGLSSSLLNQSNLSWVK